MPTIDRQTTRNPNTAALHFRRGRLRRPRPLPRAVRQPLPPRFPGEIPRVGARDRLVARQPARAHGGLPRRLRAAVAGRATSRTTRSTCSPGLTCWIFFATSLQTGARSLVESADLVKKVRFPRQLVPFSVVATQLVTFAAMLAILIVLVARVRARRAAVRRALDPAVAALPLPRRRAGADRRLAERDLPRRRAHPRRRAAALVLPHAGAVELRRAAAERPGSPDAARRAALGELHRPADLGRARHALARRGARRRRT